MTLAEPTLAPARVTALDEAIRDALRRNAIGSLEIIGAGELTTVVAWDGLACKRLPPQADRSRVEAYGALVDRYVERLRSLGVPVLPTRMYFHAHAGRHVAIMVQPRVTREMLLPEILRRSPGADIQRRLREILDHVDRCVHAGVGIDAQLANWCVVDDQLMLLDVTTPMVRDASGRDLLDTEVFVSLLPALLRPLVRRFMVQDILDQNFLHRRIVLDVVGNIVNEGMAAHTDLFLAAINPRLSPPDAPITPAEVERYRRSERLTWWVMRRAFRLERWWRRRVTHRPADHLLPASATG